MAMLDHGTEDVSADWQGARRQRRLRQRRLPHGLREDVARVRRDDLADEILDLIFGAVMLEARKVNGTLVVPNIFGSREVVLPVVERQVLRCLNADRAFRGHIKKQIATALREGHRQRTDPEEAERIPTLTRFEVPRPVDGRLVVRSAIGLGSATFLEAEPEGWNVFAASRLVAPSGADQEEHVTFGRPLHVYVMGAGAGGFARAVEALDRSPAFQVEESDQVLPEDTSVPCVVGTRTTPLRRKKYDALVVVLPSPGVGAAVNHRKIYRESRNFDLSALGPRKWMTAVQCWIAVLPELLAEQGVAFVLVPASVRDATGYASAPELLDAVLTAATEVGLDVVERLRVVEVEPVNQPFVGRHRPIRWSLTLRRAPSPEAAGA